MKTDTQRTVEQIILELLKTVSDTDINIFEIEKLIVGAACELTGSKDGRLFILDPSSGNLASHEQNDNESNTQQKEFVIVHDAFSKQADGKYRGIWGCALNTHKGTFTNSPHTHPAFIGFPPNHPQVINYLAVPVILHKEVVGLFSLANSVRDYSEKDLVEVEKLAELYAILLLRKRYEDELHQSRVNIKAMIDHVNEEVWSIDTDFRFVEFNNKFAEFYLENFHVEPRKGNHALESMTEPHKTEFAGLYNRCLKGETINLEKKVKTDANQHCLITLSPIRDNGTIIGISAISQNISHYLENQRRINRLYNEQKIISDLLLNISQTDNWQEMTKTYLDKIANLLNVTCAHLHFIGEELNPIFKIYVMLQNDSKHCLCLDKLTLRIKDELSPGKPLMFNSAAEIREKMDFGNFNRNLRSLFIYPICKADSVLGYLCFADCEKEQHWEEETCNFITTLAEVLSNILSQKISQEAVNNSFQILDKVMNNMNAIVSVVETNTYDVLFMNNHGREIYGEPGNRKCWQLVQEEPRRPCANCVQPLLETSKDGAIIVQEVLNSMLKRWYHTTNSIIEWIDGRKAHLQIAVDITETKKLETQIRKTAQELEETNATKDKFFSILAHDLKNPFFSVLGFSEMLLQKASQLLPAEIEEYARLINTSANSAHQLLQNLLVWSQTQTGKLKFQPQLTSLQLIADNCLEFVKPLAKQRKIELKKKHERVPEIMADVNMITTVLRNLLTNAVKFTSENGLVSIKLKCDEEKVKIIVEDTGIGISSEDLVKLFRIDVDHHTIGIKGKENKGTGLGLILCKEFVTLHKGTISVESKLGKGSRFTVILPLLKKS